jgi:hypothetical protein
LPTASARPPADLQQKLCGLAPRNPRFGMIPFWVNPLGQEKGALSAAAIAVVSAETEGPRLANPALVPHAPHAVLPREGLDDRWRRSVLAGRPKATTVDGKKLVNDTTSSALMPSREHDRVSRNATGWPRLARPRSAATSPLQSLGSRKAAGPSQLDALVKHRAAAGRKLSAQSWPACLPANVDCCSELASVWWRAFHSS